MIQKMKRLLFVPYLRLVLLAALPAAVLPGLHAQNALPPLQWDIAAGMGSIHMPGLGADWQHAQTVVYAGVEQPFNQRRTLSLALRFSYARGKYQGDAVSTQLLFTFSPLIANAIEPGIGLGVGYQRAFSPSKSMHWDGESWTAGKQSKGLFHVPLRLSLGYKAKGKQYDFTPYVAYQFQALFGYSPDLSLLPQSHALIGLKIASH